MTAAVAQKCPDCGQSVMTARALTMGEWREHRFTARPAIVYTIEPETRYSHIDMKLEVNTQAVRYRPDLKLYVYHEAVCPKRQLRQVVGADVAKCRSCLAAVTWVRSPAGALLPLDYERVTPYEIDQESLVLQAVEHVAPAPVFLSHFGSCPNAGLHSKKKAAAK